MPPYLLDSDIFINSHQCQYAMDFCPAFWDWLAQKNKSGRIFSIDKVCTELQEIDDGLCAWAKCQGDGFFLPFDESAGSKLTGVVAWVNGQPRFRHSAKEEFFAGADMFLIAFALAHGHVLVTQEVPRPASQTSVKIPDVCLGVGVQYISLWDLLRTEGARFVAAS